MKPRITIEDQICKKAAPGFQISRLWKVTLPSGKSRYAGAVRLFSIEDVLSSRKLQRWVKVNA